MKTKVVFLALILVSVAVSGCVSSPVQNGGQGGTGNLVLQMTDKPALDIQKAEVTVSKIEIHAASADENETEAGWITILEEPKTFDLIAIKDANAYLGEKELAPARYTQIRLTVESAVVTINGTVHNLTILSGVVKLVNSFLVEENKTTTLTLDFDAQESISKVQEDRYTMRPTIKVMEPEVSSGKPVVKDSYCTASGGQVTTSLCCQSASDFPSSCLIGACGCSPENSHEVKTCDCGEGKCFDGRECSSIETNS